jgi:hypothetical protein
MTHCIIIITSDNDDWGNLAGFRDALSDALRDGFKNGLRGG